MVLLRVTRVVGRTVLVEVVEVILVVAIVGRPTVVVVTGCMVDFRTTELILVLDLTGFAH